MSLVPVSPSSKNKNNQQQQQQQVVVVSNNNSNNNPSATARTTNNNNPRRHFSSQNNNNITNNHHLQTMLTRANVMHLQHNNYHSHHPRTDSAHLSSPSSYNNNNNNPVQYQTRDLIHSADSEHKNLEMTLQVAEDLFTKLIIQGKLSSESGGMTTQEKQFQQSVLHHYQMTSKAKKSGKSIAEIMDEEEKSGKLSSNMVSDSFDIGHSRIAISCLFLERLCAAFPRHNAAIRPIAEAIVRSIFVPDTDVTRELVGDLDCPIVLKGNDNNDNDDDDDDIPIEIVELLRPYARKTYAAAFSKISGMLKRYSKTSHSLEVRLKRQAQVFERTLAHWRKTLLRSVFVGWRSTIRRRIFLRSKYRAIFSRLREDECKARAIRLWHQRATRLRKAALADAAMQQEMSKLKMTSESLQQQIVSLLEQNATLSRDVAELERQRQLLQQEMQDRDRYVVDMNHRTAEAERLGTELLNSVLMKHDPPPGLTPLESLVRWGHEVIEVYGSIDGSQQPLTPLLSDEATLPNFPFSAFGTILSAFEGIEGIPPREAILQMHINPDQAPQMLVHYYGRVTQRPCIVTELHLKSRQRGVLLLFLASLMRFASSWMFGPAPLNLKEKILDKRKQQQQQYTFSSSSGSNNNDESSSQNDNNNMNSRKPQAGASSNSSVGAASTWMDRVRTQQRWVVVSLSAMNASLLIASDKPRILSSEEQEDEEKYCGLLSASSSSSNNNNNNNMHSTSSSSSASSSLMEDLLHSSQIDDRLPQVIKAVRNVYPEIRKLYLTYSSPTMTIDELWRLLKDSKIVSPTVGGGGNQNMADQLTKKKLQSIISLVKRLSFYASEKEREREMMIINNKSNSNNNARSTPSSTSHHRSGGGNNNNVQSPTSHDLTPLQFTVILLHISLFEHRRQMRLDNPESVMFEPFMLDSIIRSMRDHALRTDVDQFRHVVRHPLVQAVISRHKVPMRRAFRKFANCEEGESMNRNGFHQMARSCMWLSKTVTIETLNDIFRRVQKSEDVYHQSSSHPAGGGASSSPSGVSPSETIDLSEWIECICAIATFVFPNPFKPLWEKLGIFIEEKVLTTLLN